MGAPCGVMDQMTSALGEAGSLLALRCQPAEMLPPASLPPHVRLWGIDSGIRHRCGTGIAFGFGVPQERAHSSTKGHQGGAAHAALCRQSLPGVCALKSLTSNFDPLWEHNELRLLCSFFLLG